MTAIVLLVGLVLFALALFGIWKTDAGFRSTLREYRCFWRIPFGHNWEQAEDGAKVCADCLWSPIETRPNVSNRR